MKTALIGCGRIGFLLEGDPLRYKPCTHYGGARSAGLKIHGACDINRDRLRQFSETAGIPAAQRFDSPSRLLRELRPELVIVATWTESHDTIAVEAARNAARVIVLEKPMASSLTRCQKIIEECRKSGTTVIINHERRYDNRYRKVRELLAGGGIGEVRTVHASILTGGHRGPSRIDSGGGPLLHDGTHLVDMLRFLLGDIRQVQGRFQRRGRTRGFEDRAVAWLRTGGGVDVFLEAGGERDYFVFELRISGTEGAIVIGNGYEKLFRGRASRLYTGFRDLAEARFPSYKKNNCFRDLYREARRALDGEQDITSGGMDGYRALEVIHAVYLSAHRQGTTIELPVNPRSINLKKIFSIE